MTMHCTRIVRAAVVALTLAALAGGCATRAEYRFYALRSIPRDAAAEDGAGESSLSGQIYLEPVVLPEYLLRPQMVLREGVTLRVLEFDRWGEMLDVGVTRVLRENLQQCSLSPAGCSRVRVVIERFEAEGGMACLQARWGLETPDGVHKLGGEASYTRSVPPGDCAALVEVLSVMLAQLSAAINESL